MVPTRLAGSGRDGDDEGQDAGLLDRGWRPARQTRAGLFVIVGALLLAHALLGGLPGALGLTGTVEYHALSVQPDGDRLLFPGAGVEGRPGAVDARRQVDTPLLDCYDRIDPGVGCALEATLIDDPATVPRSPPDWSGYTHHGAFYERVGPSDTHNATLSLRRVPAGAVLANVSVPLRRADETVRRAVRTGQTGGEPGHAGTLVATDGAYHLVVREGVPPRETDVGQVETAVSAVFGAAVLRRGWRLAG